MIKNIVCKSLAIGAVALISISASAQESTPLRILELNADVRSQALGGAHLVTNSNNYLYTNPTHIFGTDKQFSVYAGTEFLPKYDVAGREKYVAGALAYKINEHHAVFGGIRYLSGLSIPKTNNQGIDTNTDSKPNQTTFDLGYAYNINDKFSAFATGSMIRSVTNKQTTNYTFGIGASYKDQANLFDGTLPTKWNATLSAYHLGQDLDYGKGVYFRMPSTVALGIGAVSELSEQHSIGLQLQGGYVTSYKESLVGVGASYSYRKMLDLRTGFQHMGEDMNFYSVGAGVTCGKFALDLTYRMGLGEFTHNTLSVGLSASF